MKPDYISVIDEVAKDLRQAIIPIESRVLEAWEKFEELARKMYPAYDILNDGVTESVRDHLRKLVCLLYEASPGDEKSDCAELRAKDKAYGGSWHKRGGTGAFHALARKGDRVVTQMEIYRTFDGARREDKTESIDDTLGDLRRYLILVEAWHVARWRCKVASEAQEFVENLLVDPGDEDIPF